MTERYPFDLPESTIASIEKERSPVWRRYTQDLDGNWDDPLVAFECFVWWKADLKAQLIAINQVLEDRGFKSREADVVSGDPVLCGIFRTFKALLQDFDELLSFAQAVLPHDPEMQKMVTQAQQDSATPRNSQFKTPRKGRHQSTEGGLSLCQKKS